MFSEQFPVSYHKMKKFYKYFKQKIAYIIGKDFNAID